MQTKIKGLRFWCCTLAGSASLALIPMTTAVAAEDTRVNGYVENATYGQEGVGLSSSGIPCKWNLKSRLATSASSIT